VKGANYEAPRYAVCSIFLLLSLTSNYSPQHPVRKQCRSMLLPYSETLRYTPTNHPMKVYPVLRYAPHHEDVLCA